MEDRYEFLRPLVTKWLGVIQAAERDKKTKFGDVAEQCMTFFAGAGQIWEEKYKSKYLKGKLSPKFKIALNKAFELVAVFGPLLYHRNPDRTVRPYKPTQYTPDVLTEAMGVTPEQMEQMQQASQAVQQFQQAMQQFQQAMQQAMQQAQQQAMQGMPPQQQPMQPPMPPPPEAQQMAMQFQQVQQQLHRLDLIEKSERGRNQIACDLIEKYLDFTPRVQPNGGLEQAAEDAITEALVKGRGVAWVESFSLPGSQRKLTGSFFDSVDNLLVDPDAESIDFGSARWIGRKEWKTTWEWEREFNLPPGSLEGKGSMESANGRAGRQSMEHPHLEKKRGKSFDLMCVYKIWSIGGVGTRLTGASKTLDKAFDEVVGDYAYLAVAEGVSYPLNAPTERVLQAGEDEVAEMFAWPVPYWKKEMWPCAVLDFYRNPGSAWPLALLSTGLGELTFLNVAISHLANRAWNASRTFIAILESAKSYIEEEMKKGEDLLVIGIKDMHEDIRKVVSFLQVPDVSFDLWRIIDRVFEIFDKRVGLSDLLYGMNPGGAASRSATDAASKNEKLSVRPDHMAKKVEQWAGQMAEMEKLCAYWSGVSGEDVKPLMGTVGAMLWDAFVTNADPETVFYEMDATVESGTAKKPNKDRDLANFGQVFGPMLQQLSHHADVTTDTGPLNALLAQWSDLMDYQDGSQLQMGPRQPPAPQGPDPQQQLLQLEMQAKQQELQIDQQRAQLDQQAQMVDLIASRQERQQDLQFNEAEHRQKLRQEKQISEQKLRDQRAADRLKRLQPTKTPQKTRA